MGYVTSYELEVVQGNKGIHEILEKETETTGELFYAINENGETNERCKWYDHEEDMIALSLRNPGILFLLNGEGEDARDIWRKYFIDGKMQEIKADITFEPYDESKLKEIV